MNKSHIGKWVKIGMSEKDRKKTYQKLRSTSKSILAKRHNIEYKKIFHSLIKKELNKIMEESK